MTDPEVRKLRNSRTFRNLRRLFLAENPLCAACEERGIVNDATEVMHKIPSKKGTRESFFDPANLVALCKSCGSKKIQWDKLSPERQAWRKRLEQFDCEPRLVYLALSWALSVSAFSSSSSLS